MHIHSRTGSHALVSLPVAWAPTSDPTIFTATAGGVRYELRGAVAPGQSALACARWRVYRAGVATGSVLAAWPTHVHGYVPLVLALDGDACECGCTARVKATVAAHV